MATHENRFTRIYTKDIFKSLKQKINHAMSHRKSNSLNHDALNISLKNGKHSFGMISWNFSEKFNQHKNVGNNSKIIIDNVDDELWDIFIAHMCAVLNQGVWYRKDCTQVMIAEAIINVIKT